MRVVIRYLRDFGRMTSPQCFSSQYFGAVGKYLLIIQFGFFLRIKTNMVQLASSMESNEVLKLAEQGSA